MPFEAFVEVHEVSIGALVRCQLRLCLVRSRLILLFFAAAICRVLIGLFIAKLVRVLQMMMPIV